MTVPLPAAASGASPPAAAAPAPAAEERRGRLHSAWSAWGPRGWSLRARLLAVVLALLSVVSLVIGVVSVVALRSYLIDQLDEKVATASARTANGLLGPGSMNLAFRPSGTFIDGCFQPLVRAAAATSLR